MWKRRRCGGRVRMRPRGALGSRRISGTDWQAGEGRARGAGQCPWQERWPLAALLPEHSDKRNVSACLQNQISLNAPGTLPCSGAVTVQQQVPPRASLPCLGCASGWALSGAATVLAATRPSEALIPCLFPAASSFHLHGFRNRHQHP